MRRIERAAIMHKSTIHIVQRFCDIFNGFNVIYTRLFCVVLLATFYQYYLLNIFRCGFCAAEE